MPKARILAVDDQLYFRVFLEDLLNQEGYEVCTASGRRGGARTSSSAATSTSCSRTS